MGKPKRYYTPNKEEFTQKNSSWGQLDPLHWAKWLHLRYRAIYAENYMWNIYGNVEYMWNIYVENICGKNICVWQLVGPWQNVIFHTQVPSNCSYLKISFEGIHSYILLMELESLCWITVCLAFRLVSSLNKLFHSFLKMLNPNHKLSFQWKQPTSRPWQFCCTQNTEFRVALTSFKDNSALFLLLFLQTRSSLVTLNSYVNVPLISFLFFIFCLHCSAFTLFYSLYN